MKVLLVDDEQPAIDELKWHLENYHDIEVVASFNQSKKALEFVLLNDVDVIFLDIQMPEMDGFELAEALLRLRKPPKIIFVTAYDAYALKAFEINAVDYVLKPIEQARLNRAISKLDQRVEKPTSIENMIKERYLESKSKRLPLWKDDRIYLVCPSDIVYLECNAGETFIYTSKGVFVTTEGMNHYEAILASYNFYRCHRSFMIYLEAITEVIPWFNNTYQVKVKGFPDVEIPVSRRNVKEFKGLLQL